jgi:hypothetical protein
MRLVSPSGVALPSQEAQSFSCGAYTYSRWKFVLSHASAGPITVICLAIVRADRCLARHERALLLPCRCPASHPRSRLSAAYFAGNCTSLRRAAVSPRLIAIPILHRIILRQLPNIVYIPSLPLHLPTPSTNPLTPSLHPPPPPPRPPPSQALLAQYSVHYATASSPATPSSLHPSVFVPVSAPPDRPPHSTRDPRSRACRAGCGCRSCASWMRRAG